MSERRPSMVPSRGRLGSRSYRCLLSTWWGGIVSVLKAGIYPVLGPTKQPLLQGLSSENSSCISGVPVPPIFLKSLLGSCPAALMPALSSQQIYTNFPKRILGNSPRPLVSGPD